MKFWLRKFVYELALKMFESFCFISTQTSMQNRKMEHLDFAEVLKKSSCWEIYKRKIYLFQNFLEETQCFNFSVCFTWVLPQFVFAHLNALSLLGLFSFQLQNKNSSEDFLLENWTFKILSSENMRLQPIKAGRESFWNGCIFHQWMFSEFLTLIK